MKSNVNIATTLCVGFVFCMIWAVGLGAAPISPGAFLGTEAIEDFEGLGAPGTIVAPFASGGVVYDDLLPEGGPSAGDFQYGDDASSIDGIDNFAIATSCGTHRTISIQVTPPVYRAGGWLAKTNSAGASWSAEANFFDEADNLLGTVPVTGNVGEAEFFGFQADDAEVLIGSVTITDTTSLSATVADDGTLILDNFKIEMNAELIPVLSDFGIVLLTIVLAAFAARRISSVRSGIAS